MSAAKTAAVVGGKDKRFQMNVVSNKGFLTKEESPKDDKKSPELADRAKMKHAANQNKAKEENDDKVKGERRVDEKSGGANKGTPVEGPTTDKHEDKPEAKASADSDSQDAAKSDDVKNKGKNKTEQEKDGKSKNADKPDSISNVSAKGAAVGGKNPDVVAQKCENVERKRALVSSISTEELDLVKRDDDDQVSSATVSRKTQQETSSSKSHQQQKSHSKSDVGQAMKRLKKEDTDKSAADENKVDQTAVQDPLVEDEVVDSKDEESAAAAVAPESEKSKEKAAEDKEDKRQTSEIEGCDSRDLCKKDGESDAAAAGTPKNTTESSGRVSSDATETKNCKADGKVEEEKGQVKTTTSSDPKEKSRTKAAVASSSVLAVKEETRKRRKPSETSYYTDDVDGKNSANKKAASASSAGVDEDFELPKRLKQSLADEVKKEDTIGDESITPPEVRHSTSTDKDKSSRLDRPNVPMTFADYVHSSEPEVSRGSIVEITRAHEPITSALPSSSTHSSQEDLTSISETGGIRVTGSGGSGVAGDLILPALRLPVIIDDCDKLRQDQAKSLSRAKAMLAAAFSDAESDSETDDVVLKTEKRSGSSVVPSMELIGGKDADMF